jgi:HD-like signal output (HDOD) protein
MNNLKKTRILFVDDEPMILKMLQLSLRSMAKEWEMSFVESGEAALELLNQKPFDVVVSDMRMPGMSGAELLNTVMKKQPQTVRIILSGYADEEMVLQCVGASHQFLCKPFDPKVLKSCLQRIATLHQQMDNPDLVRMASSMQYLPSIPSIYFQIMEALQSSNASIQLISEIVSRDAGLTAKLLQLVNSAFFGVAVGVSSAEEAVQLLGVGRIRSLALFAHVFASFDEVEMPQEMLNEIWNHSMATGMAARQICEQEESAVVVREQGFTAGLLHDVGKLIFLANKPSEYLKVQQQTLAGKKPLVQVEQEVFGVNHAHVGAYLLGIWGLPAPLVEAVAWHHTPQLSGSREFNALTAVHAADVLVRSCEGAHDDLPMDLDAAYLGQMGYADHVPAWRDRLANC